MNNLFELVQEDFFVLLTLKEKHIYIEALILIWEKYKIEVGEMTKDYVIKVIVDHFGYNLVNMKFDELEQNDEVSDINSQARKIVNKASKYGWIKEFDDPKRLETFIEIPYYSSRIIDVLSNIISPQIITSVNFASSVYLNITSIGNGDKDEYLIYLENASRETDNLVNFLSETFDNMKRYYNNLIKEMTVNGILKEHFEEYTNEIVGQRFHKIITNENIFKYRQSIISKIDTIEYDNDILNTLISSEKDKHGIDKDAAEYEVFEMLSKVKSCFEVIDIKIDKLKGIHHKYIKTSSERIQYLMQKEKNIKESIFNVLKVLQDEQLNINEILSKNIGINYISNISEKSMIKPYKHKEKGRWYPDIIDITSKQDKHLRKNYIIESNKKKYSLSQIYSEKSILEFLENLLSNEKEFNTKNFIINSNSDFIKLVLAYNIASKRKHKFSVERKLRKVNINGYVIPEIIFRRKY